ncbi:hypothetical protein FZEAL_7932 [Fusarium zealandicum]|uniref:Cyclopropane-fatty-acyl-phospholipid synthase n=1 Tax=Fusarium zealandicum TaxID=1053134 RepID=A0A8H4XHD9_9HYPO|nr:hypothetical protein FZEAL_7932 [Fusarium zealandicum]
MDGLSEGSPLLPVVLIGDFIDRLRENWPLSSVTALAVSVYYALFGTLLDFWLILSFVGWNHASALASLFHHLDMIRACLLICTTVGAFALGHRILQCIFTERPLPWKGLGRPLLIPSRTSHTRFFPEKHSFSYSYLVAGVPVGFSGNANGMISADVPGTSSWLPYFSGLRAWFDVDPADYLQRGHTKDGLRGKLESFLKSQNVDPSQYPHAYLVTAARFLGYHFNPVSFWFLYSSAKVLSAIVLEVNNTFGERRPYLVIRDFEAEAKHIEDQTPNSESKEPHRARVKATWQKDFHVSPFNSRKGSYSLLARDPLGPGMEGFRGIDMTINLGSSKGHPKLVARLFSEGEALDPDALNVIARATFLLSWFGVGFVTFPRIVKEAALLFFKRGLHVWYRPEPLKESMGRLADSTEKSLEDVFRQYLQHLVGQSPAPIVVKYISSGVAGAAEEVFTSPSAIESPTTTDNIEIKVLTPVFYSRFVHYAHDFEAVFGELAESCTLWVDKPELLPKIFLKKASPTLHASSIVDFLCFQLIRSLRSRPERIERPLTSADTSVPRSQGLDIRDFRMSSMDAFVLGQDDTSLKKAYRAAAVRLFVADRIAFGNTDLLGMMEFTGRVGVSWVLGSLINQAIQGFS